MDSIKLYEVDEKYIDYLLPIAPHGVYTYVDIAQERNPKYKALLLNEYRYIKSVQEKIRKNAVTLYNHKNKEGNATALAKRCNDFKQLEQACREYKVR